jgi:predicted PurR-regulated permease PerM
VLAFVSLFEQADEIAATASDGAGDIDSAASGQLGAVSDTIESGGAAAVETIANLSGAIPAIITVTVLATLLAFYFLRDGGELWRRVVTHASPRHRSWIDAAAGRAFGVLGGYMVGTAAISFVGAASMFVIMVLLGLPLALPVFVLSFILGFIPYIGSLISTLIAFLIAVAVGSTTDVVIMGLWTLVFNIVQGNVVSPLVYGRTVHLHPAVVLVAIPAGSAVAGVLGMFLVVPALGAVAATWRTVIALLGGTVPETPAAIAATAEADSGPADPVSSSGST